MAIGIVQYSAPCIKNKVGMIGIIPGPACILNSIVTMVVGIDAEGVDL